MLSLLLFTHFGCTEPPKYSYISNFPAILPEGEFFNLRNSVLTNNASQVGVIFADSYFENKQNLFLQKYELGSQFVSKLSFLFVNYMFELKQSELNYKYDVKGDFQRGRGHTVLEGKLIGDVAPNQPIPESIKKFSKIVNDKVELPDTISIYMIWESDEICWKILHMEIENINLNDLLK